MVHRARLERARRRLVRALPHRPRLTARLGGTFFAAVLDQVTLCRATRQQGQIGIVERTQLDQIVPRKVGVDVNDLVASRSARC